MGKGMVRTGSAPQRGEGEGTPGVCREEKGAVMGAFCTHTRGCIPSAHVHAHTPQSELPRMSGGMQLLHIAGVVFHLGHLSLGLQMGLII